jgi:hypothetical protein
MNAQLPYVTNLCQAKDNMGVIDVAWRGERPANQKLVHICFMQKSRIYIGGSELESIKFSHQPIPKSK